MLVCGDPEAPETYFAGFPKDQVSPICCPDNVAFDAVGNLWISTDGNRARLATTACSGCRSRARSAARSSSSSPCRIGAETCGPLITDDDRSVFVAVQHPGETDGATFENPASTWPHTHDFPRPGVVVTSKA